jgi:hypothetical protein
MTTASNSESLPPVYLELYSSPPKGKPVAKIKLRHGGMDYEGELWVGKTKDGKRTLGGTARPADGRKRLDLLFADAEREELAAPPAADGVEEYKSRPGAVLLFYNDRGADLSGYFTVPDTGEQLRPSVFMKGSSYGTGPLQTEAEYRAALAERAAPEEEAPGAPTQSGKRRDKVPHPDSLE